MLITVRDASFSSPLCSWQRRFSTKLKYSIFRASFSVQRTPNTTLTWNPRHVSTCYDASNFDPLGINPDLSSRLNSTWENVVSLFSQTFESASSTDKEKPNSSRGIAAAIEDSSIDFGDFFKGPLPGKFLKLLGFLALSRLGVYIPLASCTGISEVARSSEKRRRGWKKESSSIHSICVSWICNCTAEADMQKLSHALKVISKNQRTWFTAALLQLSAEEYPPADATDDKLYLKGATNRDGDFCSTSSTGESLKNIATGQCDEKSYRLGLQICKRI